MALKGDIDESFSYALIYDTPFDASARYPSSIYAGTGGHPTTKAITGLLRYKINQNFSIHGGPRIESLDAPADLPFLNYHVSTNTSYGVGYSVGGAFEIPEIAARVVLTYNSKIKHDVQGYETGAWGTVKSDYTVNMPASVNLDFQTGIAPNTLLFGGVRWVNWSKFEVSPTQLYASTGQPLLSYEKDIYTYTLGLGHKFSDHWSGAIIGNYEPRQNITASPLKPIDGMKAGTLAGTYSQNSTDYTVALTYGTLGDVSTPGVGSFDGNFKAITFKLAHNF